MVKAVMEKVSYDEGKANYVRQIEKIEPFRAFYELLIFCLKLKL